MADEQKAAYINAQTACAMIEAMGMVAENALRKQREDTIAYTFADFMGLIEKYGIYHNAVCVWINS